MIPHGYDLIGTQMPWWLVISCRNRWYLKTFVEGGAGYGDTSAIACEHFAKVFAIEVVPDVYRAQRKELISSPKATRLLGTTECHLPDLVKAIDTPTLWYLDSHWPGMGAKLGPECPLLNEIDILMSRNSLPHDVILIDNAGLFFKPPPPPHAVSEWPSIGQVADAMHRACRGMSIQFFCDIIIATPEPLWGTI